MIVKILPATPEDAEYLSNLINSAYRGSVSKQGWTTEADLLDGARTDAKDIEEIFKKPGATILKCMDGQKIIGCVELVRQKNKLYLGMLTVDPLLQGKGNGKKLMAAAEEHARKCNCSVVYMTVISVREELIAWYKRRGYRDTGERKPFAFNDPRFGIPKQELEFAILEKPL